LDISGTIEFPVDYRRPSQERDQEEKAASDPEATMTIPGPGSVAEDWKITVQKAFDDTSRATGL